jgi:hypothetical protein
LRTFYLRTRLFTFENRSKMIIFQSKMDFLSANSRFAVQNDGTYLSRIMRETCNNKLQLYLQFVSIYFDTNENRLKETLKNWRNRKFVLISLELSTTWFSLIVLLSSHEFLLSSLHLRRDAKSILNLNLTFHKVVQNCKTLLISSKPSYHFFK